jgi:hypothetical protein
VELLHGSIKLPFFVQNGCSEHNGSWIIRDTLIHVGFARRQLILLILDGGLQMQHAITVLRILHHHYSAHRVLVQGSVIQALRPIYAVLLNAGGNPNQLLVGLCCLLVILEIVVAVSQ